MSFAVEYVNKVRDVCLQYYTPVKMLPDNKPNPEDRPDIRAEAINGAICVASVARIFKMLETMNAEFVIPVISDLSFALNENSFWKQHGATLIPLYKTALQSKLLAMGLSLSNNPDDDNIIKEHGGMWHSIPIAAYSCIYGVAKTALIAGPFAKDLEKVL